MKVVSIANQKGGIGKTTLSLLLCNTLSQEPYNLNIKLLDIDHQLSAYFLRETEKEGKESFPYEIIQFKDIKNKEAYFNLLEELSHDTDFLFVDPPGNLLNLEAFVMSLDYCFIPFKAGDLDFHSSLKFIEFLEEHSKDRKKFNLPDTKLYFFVNDYKKTINYRNMLQFFDKQDVGARPLTYDRFTFKELIKLPHRTDVQNVNSYDSIYKYDENHFSEFYHFANSIKILINGEGK